MTAFVSSATLLLAAVSVLAMFSFSTVVLAVDPDEIPDGPVFEPTNAQVEKFHRVCKATTEAALSDEPGVYEANEEDIRFAEVCIKIGTFYPANPAEYGPHAVHHCGDDSHLKVHSQRGVCICCHAPPLAEA